ncbi:Prolyl tripeptidyl peptidase precursor [Anatilimnocola aggregata]|uniref:Prolyl tripeptidyl peptidase n=1 Tax=Anatilimnocola aggregata TaxID=2528021 RepID=A0A517YJT2_9BACT|nr:alpha/beta fold hydrolase [Anatilimnocola aggregata]QDU30483.1 Prolyl tripeptidyl peptidase precursor [Anatilimnocola aggregata]
MNCRNLVVAGMLSVAAQFAVSADEPADPLRPGAIQTEEVPVVPPSLARRLQQYQSLRAAGFAGWDPAGKGILIRTRFGNSLQLHRVYEPGGRREQITFFDEPVSGGFIPQAKDEAVLLSMSSGGSENNQVYLLDRQRFETKLLTDGKSRNNLGAVSPDGSQMIVGSNKRNGRDTDLYIANCRGGELQMLMETEKEFWSAVDWSQDGKQLLLLKYVSVNESYPAIFNLSTNKRSDLPLPGKEKGAFGPLAFSPDGKNVYLATDTQGEFAQLARLDLASGKYEWLAPEIEWDVTDIEVEPKSGAVVFAVNADGASQVFLLTPKAGGTLAKRELKLPLGIVSSLEFSPDGKHVGMTLARPDAPADAYSLELESGNLTRWTMSEVGGLNPATFIKPTAIRFPSFDGRQIPAWFYKPRTASADNKVPVVISIHGGPESQSQPYFTGSTQFYLNELGVAVILPNVRGSNGYGKTYLKLDNAEKREDSVRDIGALLDWIKTQPELDADRVAVSGGSYGGYMVLASLVHYGDRIRAGIDNVGIANFNTFLQTTAAYRQDLRRVEYGDERDPAMKAVFDKISPANHAEKIRSALLVAHGKNDPRVPFSEAEQIAAKVRGQGKSVWTVYADNEGHGFGKKDNADYLRAVEVMFLSEQLKLKK